MPKRSSTTKRQSDAAKKQLDKNAKRLAENLASDGVLPSDLTHLIAVALGRRGGLKGGKARAEKLSATRRSAIARLAAQKRWSKPQDD
jgi:hypothetical protein